MHSAVNNLEREMLRFSSKNGETFADGSQTLKFIYKSVTLDPF